jgi:hypothetical protein
MKVNDMSFRLTLGTYIAARSAGEYAHGMLDFFDENDKDERNYKRRFEKLKTATDDILKITSRILKHENVIDAADDSVDQIETVIYEVVSLDEIKLERVLKYIKRMK